MRPSGEGFFREVLDALPSAIAVLDGDGRIVMLNRAWRERADKEGHPIGLGDDLADLLRIAGARGGNTADLLRVVLDGARPAALLEPPTGLLGGPLVATALGGGGAVLMMADRATRPSGEGTTRLLAEAGALFATTLDPEGLLRSLARLAVPDVAEVCLADLVDPDRTVRRVAITHLEAERADRAWSVEEHLPRPSARTAPRVVRTGEAELFEEVDEDALVAMARSPDHVEALRPLGLASAVMAPLVAGGHILGALTLGTATPGRRLGDVDLAFAVMLAERVASALDNTRLFREAQEGNRLKDELLATLSHELRTPLGAIMGWAHVLRGGTVDRGVIARAVDAIDRNAQAQTQLITNILDVSRMVTGKLRLSVGAVELPVVIEGAVRSVRGAAAAKGVAVETEIDSLAGPVSGDPDRMQQVIANLLSNAVKFTPRGGQVVVRLAHEDGQARVEVEDNGIGVSAELLPHLFERFRAPESSTSRPHTGIGLGLAIVRHLVELHSGTVEATSRGRGQGSRFILRFPVIGARPGALLPPGSPERPGRRTVHAMAPSLEGVCVLVVDDEKDARDVVAAVLEQRGARVVLATSVAEAMARIQEDRPDVILSDIGMPEEDGYALMRRIRALPAEQGGATPAAALTAYARSEDRMQALLAGYQVHVPKPVQPAELIAVVASLASRRPSRVS